MQSITKIEPEKSELSENPHVTQAEISMVGYEILSTEKKLQKKQISSSAVLSSAFII